MSNTIHQQLQVLSEPLRTRMLRVLAENDVGITVSELTRILASPQSTISRHLKVLDQAGWITRNALGASNLLRLDTPALDEDQRNLWLAIRDRVDAEDDLRRLHAVLALRKVDPAQFFGSVAPRWEALRTEMYGQAYQQAILLAMLDPSLVVADLGCGPGDLLTQLAPHVAQVIGIDRDPSMLARAKAAIEKQPNAVVHEASLDQIPLADGSVDVAVCALVLHTVEQPNLVLQEVARILTPQGRLVVVDLLPHPHEELRENMGHRHLGFDQAGFKEMGTLSCKAWVALPHAAEQLGPPMFLGVFSR